VKTKWRLGLGVSEAHKLYHEKNEPIATDFISKLFHRENKWALKWRIRQKEKEHVERLNRAGSNGSVKFAAASCLRGLALRNTVADAASKLGWSAILNGTNQKKAKPPDTGTIWNIRNTFVK
jgi:hypothetical protein